jgi:hypothetical protein
MRTKPTMNSCGLGFEEPQLVKVIHGIPIEAAQRASFSGVSLECPRSG